MARAGAAIGSAKATAKSETERIVAGRMMNT